jgi:5-methylcytosine-specific restriction endonuclease McrA
VREAARRWRAANAERVRAQKRQWRKANAEKVRAAERAWYAVNKEKKAEWHRRWLAENLDKAGAGERRWREANASRARAAERLWREANPDRVREHQHRRRDNFAPCDHPACLTIGVIPFAMQLFRPVCAYCARHLDYKARQGDPAFVHFDHVVPLSRGGLHCIDNIRPACATCNLSKNDRTPAEWNVWARFLPVGVE